MKSGGQDDTTAALKARQTLRNRCCAQCRLCYHQAVPSGVVGGGLTPFIRLLRGSSETSESDG